MQPWDYSLNMMNSYAGDESTKQQVALFTLFKESYNRDGKIDALDWIVLGHHFAKIQEDESAF